MHTPADGGKMPLRSFVTDRPVGILVVFLAAVVFGVLSLEQLPVTLMPELTYPTLTVRTEYAGAAPEEVENDISRPVEEALGVIQGLKKVSSVSRAGVSDVILEFAWDTEMSDATQDVLEKLDLVFLPDDADRPLILHYDPSLDPVLELSLSGEGERFEGEAGLRRLRRLADLQIKKELEPLKGVAAVRVRGGLEEEIHVLLQEEALQRSNLSIQQVISRLAEENINVAGGTLQEGRTEYLVRTLNEFENLQQIEEMIVTELDGREVRIRDLGRVEMAHKEREIVTRTGGAESVQVEILKEGDANIVALAKRVKTALGKYDFDAEGDAAATAGASGNSGKRGRRGKASARPSGLIEQLYKNEGARLAVVADRSLFIESSISDVRNTALIGGLLAILVLAVFLRNGKSTAIVAASIPISLLMTFAPLKLMGVSLNIMSLGGLALGIGMLVDSSIVVLESIYRCREEGDDVGTAAVRGTGEVRGAVFASTLTSIAVFFPMVFVEGIAGQAFGDLGTAVVVSLLASAAVALFFIPMLASRQGMRLEDAGPDLEGKGFFGRMVARARWTVEGAVDRVVAGFAGWPRWFFTFRSVRDFPSRLNSYLRTIKPSRPQSVLGWFVSPIVLLLKFVVALLGLGFLPLIFLLGLVLEVAGKLLTMVVMSLAWLLTWLLFPVLRVVTFLVMFLPTLLTQLVLRLIGGAYPTFLRGALAAPVVVVLLVGVCLFGTWQVVQTLESELLPEVHQGEFTVEVALPVGTPLQETERIVAPVEAAILTEQEHIDALILTVGYDSATSSRSDEGEHTAKFKVLLADGSRGQQVEQAVIDRLRERFVNIPDLETQVVRPVLFSQKTPIEVEVHGFKLDELKGYGEQVATEMARLPELADVELSLRRGAPEVQVVYDRERLSRYNLNIQEVAVLVRDKVKGFEATRFNMKDRRIPILVRLEEADRETVDDIRAMNVNPGGDRPIRLDSVAQVTLGEGPSEVRRIDGRRVALISANLGEGSLSEATFSIEETLQGAIDWPGDMTFFITGQNEEWERSQASLWVALALSLFLVYVIMAAQFESLVHPLVIMLTIPLAFVGTFFTMKALGISLSIVVFLGMIMLAGIVVNNAIVLVDYINTLRRRGIPRNEAIVEAGKVRLRPILMTTATTVLGLLPMAIGVGDGAEIRTPMAIAVISGLISSTVLTLVVIPCFYMLMDGAVRRLLRRPSEHPADDRAGDASIAPGSQAVTP